MIIRWYSMIMSNKYAKKKIINTYDFLLSLIMQRILDKNSIIQTLHSHREELAGFGVDRIGLFGSYSKNKTHPNSDIDFLVEIQKEKKTFRNFMALAYFLEDLFQKKVDLVTPQSLSPYIGPHI